MSPYSSSISTPLSSDHSDMDINRRGTKRQSCWTCKGSQRNFPSLPRPTLGVDASRILTIRADRKILCDGASPICMNCTKSKRECTRLVTRLSWPKPKDGRRLIISHHVLPSQALPETGLSFLNTSDWDITLQMGLGENNISRTMSLLPFPKESLTLSSRTLQCLAQRGA